jgi:hypothetical protein
MAFTYDLTTTLGQVRLLASDTDASSYDFEDAEIAFIQTQTTTLGVLGAAAMLFEVLAGSHAKLALRKTRLAITEDLSKIAEELRAQARLWRAQAEAESGDTANIHLISPSWTRAEYERNILLDDADIEDYAQEKTT